MQGKKKKKENLQRQLKKKMEKKELMSTTEVKVGLIKKQRRKGRTGRKENRKHAWKDME